MGEQGRRYGRVRGRGIKQHSFVGGEISPELYSRSDIERYSQSLRTCRNFQITTKGAAQNRAGTQFIREVKDSTDAVRLMEFVFNVDQAYVLEFGDQYIRFHRDAGTILATSGSDDTSAGHATIMTDSTAAFTVDALIGMTVYNLTDRSSGVITDNDATTITVASLADGVLNTWTSGDLYDVPYEITSPYTATDLEGLLFRLQTAQIRDVMTIVHPDFPPQELKRLADATWTLMPLSVVSPVNPPTDLAQDNSWDGADGTHPVEEWEWVVCSVDINGRRSIASDPLTDTACVLYKDKTKPKISWTAPTAGNAPDYYEIYRGKDGIHGYVGSSESVHFIDSADIPDYFDSPPEARDPFTYTTTLEEEAAGGEVTLTPDGGGVCIKTGSAEAYDDNYSFTVDIFVPEPDPPFGPTDEVEFSLQYDKGAGFVTAATYSVIGRPLRDYEGTKVYTVSVDEMGADPTSQFRVLYVSGGGTATLVSVAYTEAPTGTTESELPNYPATVCYFEQRRMFARFTEDVQRVIASQTADFSNFDRSSPVRDDDALELTQASLRLDEVRSIVPGPFGVYLFGAASEAVLRGAEGAPLTPSSFDLKTQTHFGSSWVSALPVGNAILFVADRDRSIREFRFASRGGGDNDAREISLFASHLFERYGVKEWAYADVPDSMVWVVRSDGTLVGLTYVRDQNVFAFHRHDTGGLDATGGVTDKFESVCSVPEGVETAVYVVVNRTIDGSTKRYIERFAKRYQSDTDECVFLDCSLQYDGTLAPAVTATGGSTWAPDESVTLTAASAAFVAGNVTDHVWLIDSTGIKVRLEIQAFTSTTVVTARIIDITGADKVLDTAMPASLQGAAAAEAHLAVKDFSGLYHLEGETLGVYSDSAVQTDVTVASGAVTLEEHASRVTVGLRYDCDLESLQLEMPGDYGTSRAARKIVTAIGMEVDNYRGLQAGGSLDDLYDVQQRDTADEYSPIDPSNTLVYMYPSTTYDRTARVSVRQTDPLPVTILSLIPEMEVGD